MTASTLPPVTPVRIKIATDYGLANVPILAVACRQANVPFFVACALMEQESHGHNVYGHDAGGALSGFPGEVNAENYAVFRWLVFDCHQTSNGVGPCQLTYSGYFTDMERKGLKPYDVHDNMLYGLQILAQHYADTGQNWQRAGAAYNGSGAYGVEFMHKVTAWKSRLHIR